MNYEIKAIRPASVFANAIRIFVVVGFIAAIYSFFISPYSGLRLAQWWQKILATLLFTGVYAFVVSIILWFIVRIYNAYILEFDPRSLLMYNVTTFLIPGACVCAGRFLTGLSAGAFFSNLGTSFFISILFILGGSSGTTILILTWHAFFGPSQGISVELNQSSDSSQS